MSQTHVAELRNQTHPETLNVTLDLTLDLTLTLNKTLILETPNQNLREPNALAQARWRRASLFLYIL